MVILGIGFSSAAKPAEVVELARQLSAGHEIDGIATIASKRGSAVIAALEDVFKVPVFFYEASALETMTERLKNPSDQLFKRIGCHGVAEAAALMAAGKQAVLIVEKVSFANATFALAQTG
ncbi:cobalamin biosynthesis protein [Paenochrobactrum glaciei]|uniref:Cobalamin biosynthesis protein n=1 Tax=Paenochrobactrum glaciei TaxID=486407 RepID=A0ABN1FZV0_9HYPH